MLATSNEQQIAVKKAREAPFVLTPGIRHNSSDTKTLNRSNRGGQEREISLTKAMFKIKKQSSSLKRTSHTTTKYESGDSFASQIR
jgi:hypothetical protein